MFAAPVCVGAIMMRFVFCKRASWWPTSEDSASPSGNGEERWTAAPSSRADTEATATAIATF